MDDHPLPLATHPTDPSENAGATLNQTAYRRLEEMIVTLELKPGSIVSEASLSKRLNIGTTPIREALQRLGREYLVRILPRRGVVVTDVDIRQQLQVLEVRRELDRLLARAAARRGSPAERQEFARLAERMRAAGVDQNDRAIIHINQEFNQLTAKAARNEIAAATVAALHAVSRRFWFFHYKEHADLAKTAALHTAVMQAIAAGDGDAAAHASDDLLDYLTAFAKATLRTD